MASRSRRRFIEGPLGSGKTFTCAFEALRCCQEQAPGKDGVRRSAGLVCRTTMPELKTTALKDWTQLMDVHFRGALGSMHWGPPPIYSLRFKLPDNTRVEADVTFMGLDDPDGVDKVRGMPLTWAWANEFREIPFGLLAMIFGRCGRFPRMEDGGPSWYGMFGDTNMPDPEHWVYKFAEEEHPEGWEFYRQPGGVMKVDGRWVPNPHAENLDFLPPGYYEEQLAGASDDWIAVYLGAEYGFVKEGKPVFPEYVDSTHCKEFAIVPGVPLRLGLDFGLTPAGIFGQRLPTGAWRWHSELTTDGVGVIRFAELLKLHIAERYKNAAFESFENITGDPAGDARQPGDEEERTCFQLLGASGVKALPAHTNDPVIRREVLAKPMRAMVDGAPGFLLHPDCRVTRRGMAGGYCYRRVRVSGSERYQDKPAKDAFSHPIEAGEYMMLGAGEGRALVRQPPRQRRQEYAVGDYPMFS